MFTTGNNLATLYALFEHLDRWLPAAFPSVSEAAGNLLITAIWQGAIVAACLALTLRFAGRLSAGLRFTLWTAGFLAVAALPFLPIALRAFPGPVLHSANGLTAAPRLNLDFRWSIALCLLWAAVSLYRGFDLAAHTIRLRSLWRAAKPIADIGVPVRLRGRRPIQVCTTQALDRPSVIGFFAPRILIPEWLLPRLTPGELNQILIHETEHLRRGDDWTNLLQKLSLILFPLNPVLLWMERRLCLEREMACDEAVIRVTNSPRAYAACLTNLAERGLHRDLERDLAHRAPATEALSLGAWRRRPELVERVHSLLSRKPVLGTRGARAVAVAFTCALVFGSVELARCPQLVAFVPAHPAAEASLSQPAPGQITGKAGELLTAWKPANPERGGRAYMVETRAIVSHRPETPAALAPWQRPSARSLASLPSPQLSRGAQPRQVLLKAEAPATQQQTPEEGWLVMTTWEEVAVSGSEPASAPAAVQTLHPQPLQPQPAQSLPAQPLAAQNTRQPAAPVSSAPPQNQIRVTRMVFRVVPATFASPSPAAIRTQDGWLVIQM